MTDMEQKAVVAIAIGETVAKTWEGKKNAGKNNSRIEKAASMFGLNGDMVDLAKQYYQSSYKF